ncbi:HAMP domain-containing histidine kinase [Hoyosella sp. YIM 151337]|uniref:sensor histidine kinase n=1 Tax=Hoyosella sp. YIM 151337 TaxID=2992742 RepID=UPI002235E471|nr:HAMP domain-containing sensor histidine kinase [Hoyosella sp. YIM 151337]MCW4355997.1 HAMP domain-containing histidine kinase [Hoyosella sp. YIM 151337]
MRRRGVLQRIRLASPSLLTRAALAAAAGATIVVVTVAVFVWSGVQREAYAQLDQRLDVVGTIAATVANQSLYEAREQIPDDYEATYRAGPVVIRAHRVTIPELPEGYATEVIDGTEYRVRTIAVPDRPRTTISVAAPTEATEEQIRDERRNTILVSMLAIAAAAGLGWLLGGFAIRPLRQLAGQTRIIDPETATPRPHVTGAREAEELAAAISGMLERISREKQRTSEALHTARDFAAVSAHELRTPLTAMRTNLEVLETLDPPEPDRREVIAETLQSVKRIEQILHALERLAAGSLTATTDYEDVDLAEVLYRSAHEAQRLHPELEVHVHDAEPTVIRGLAAGLRLAVDNAITNAVRHGGAERVELSLRDGASGQDENAEGCVDITIDDDGCGIPLEDRDRVFERFARGSRVHAPGSGLGLALVAQQAELHGGRAFLADSPLGGARLVLRVRI